MCIRAFSVLILGIAVLLQLGPAVHASAAATETSLDPFVPSPWFDHWFEAIPDFDGDGFHDLLEVSAGPASPDPEPGRSSRVRVLDGDPDRAAANRVLARWDVAAPRRRTRPGVLIDRREVTQAAIAAGDIDGDGNEDLAIGSASSSVRGRDGAGSVRLLFGRRSGGSAATESAASGVRIAGDRPRAHVGHSLAAVGDVDGDGLDDLAIGGARSAFVVLGHRRARDIDLRRRSPHVIRVTDPMPGFSQNFHRVWSIGDTDGDGRGEVLVGVDRLASSRRFRPARLWRLNRVGESHSLVLRRGARDAQALPAPRAPLDAASVAAGGDFDGDGLSDIAVAAGSETVVIRRRDRRRSPLVTRLWQRRVIRHVSPAFVADADDDGDDELVLGIPDADGAGCLRDSGRVVVVGGTARRSVSLDDAAAAWLLTSGEAGGQAVGEAVTGSVTPAQGVSRIFYTRRVEDGVLPSWLDVAARGSQPALTGACLDAEPMMQRRDEAIARNGIELSLSSGVNIFVNVVLRPARCPPRRLCARVTSRSVRLRPHETTRVVIRPTRSLAKHVQNGGSTVLDILAPSWDRLIVPLFEDHPPRAPVSMSR